MKVKLPYRSNFLEVNVPDENVIDIIYPNEMKPEMEAGEYIKKALANPMGSHRIRDIAEEGMKVSLVVDDNTTI